MYFGMLKETNIVSILQFVWARLQQRGGWICIFAAFLVGALFLVAGSHKVWLVTTGMAADPNSGLDGAFTAIHWFLRTRNLPHAEPAVTLVTLGSFEILFGLALVSARRRRAFVLELAALLLSVYTLGLALARPYLRDHWCGCTGVSFIDGQSALWAIVRNGVLIAFCLFAAGFARRPADSCRYGPTAVEVPQSPRIQ